MRDWPARSKENLKKRGIEEDKGGHYPGGEIDRSRKALSCLNSSNLAGKGTAMNCSLAKKLLCATPTGLTGNVPSRTGTMCQWALKH